MSDQPLIIRDDKLDLVKYSPEVEKLREDALKFSALIAKVTNPEENAEAVAAQIELQKVIKAVDKAAAELIDNANAFKTKVWATQKKFKEELTPEMTRVSTLIGDFQTLEQAKVRAAEQLQKQELDRIEREKQEALSKATSHEALDAVQEHYNNIAAQTVIEAPTPVRAEGQVVRTNWEITVINPFDLVRFHPNCVTIAPKLTEIKALLDEGMAVKGITAKKVVTSGVVLPKGAKAIEV